MGGDRRPQVQQPHLHQTSQSATEGQGQAGLRCANPRKTQLRSVLYERRVHGMRSGIQIQHRRPGSRQWIRKQ